MESTNRELVHYLQSIARQIGSLLGRGHLLQLALIVIDSGGRNVERWQFEVTTFPTASDTITKKEEQSIRSGLQKVLRQISVTTAVMPLLRGKHSIRIAVSQDPKAAVPSCWIEAESRLIEGPQEINLHPLRTGKHSFKTNVQFKGLDH